MKTVVPYYRGPLLPCPITVLGLSPITPSSPITPITLALGAGERSTLLYAARNESHNNAWVLREHLLEAGSAGWIGYKPG